MRTKKRTTKLGIKLLLSFALIPILISSTLATTPWSASAQTSLRLPVSQGATQRFIVTVASRSDVAIIANKVEAAGATVDYRFTKVLIGFSAFLSTAQVVVLSDDPRVLSIDLDEKISLDSVETNTSTPPEAGDVIPGRYIVTLKSTANQSSKAGVLSILGNSVIAEFTEVFTGYTADLTPAQLAALESNPAVKDIEQDQVITINSDQLNPPWGLDRIDQSDLPLNQHYVDRSNGAGVTVYVVDTGIAPHTEFGTRLAIGRNYAGNLAGDLNYTDCNGHGTHVAGIIGSNTYGVAERVAAPRARAKVLLRLVQRTRHRRRHARARSRLLEVRRSDGDRRGDRERLGARGRRLGGTHATFANGLSVFLRVLDGDRPGSVARLVPGARLRPSTDGKR